MDITLSCNNGAEVYVLPVVLEAPDINRAYKNEQFETMNNIVNLAGNPELIQVSISSFFPVNKSYPFANKKAISNGWEYVSFIERCADNKIPMRIVINDSTKTILNLATLVNNFSYKIDRKNDIQYTLELLEYRFVNVKQV